MTEALKFVKSRDCFYLVVFYKNKTRTLWPEKRRRAIFTRVIQDLFCNSAKCLANNQTKRCDYWAKEYS